MSKKIVALLLLVAMALTLTACGGTTTPAPSASQSAPAAPKDDFKIGIMTNTISQSEESYRAADSLAKKYPNMVVHVTYPDKFTAEQETTISTMLSLAADPKMKAIIGCEAVVGTAAAFAKIKAVRPDILLIAAQLSDDPKSLSAAMDVGFTSDMPEFANQLTKAAKDMGAKTFVYYTFPRHIARTTTAIQIKLFEKAAPEMGLKFVMATAPDPLSDAGVAGSQQFILEDIPRKVKEYGKDTAFYSTNIGQAEPMIKAVLNTKAIFMMPSDPSPFSGYPGALGIAIPADKRGDVKFMEEQISAVLKTNGMTGRMGLWTVPLLTFFVNGGFDYALGYCRGEFKEKMNMTQLQKSLEKVANAKVGVRTFTPAGSTEELKNYIMVLGAYKTL